MLKYWQSKTGQVDIKFWLCKRCCPWQSNFWRKSGSDQLDIKLVQGDILVPFHPVSIKEGKLSTYIFFHIFGHEITVRTISSGFVQQYVPVGLPYLFTWSKSVRCWIRICTFTNKRHQNDTHKKKTPLKWKSISVDVAYCLLQNKSFPFEVNVLKLVHILTTARFNTE